jgi:23S rRNA (cytosine1962-C5)-methyltransferase
MQAILENLQQLHVLCQSATAESPQLDSRRIFHGRGRCYPGLEFVCVDFFQPVLLITLYSEPLGNWLEEFVASAQSLFSPGISVVLAQHRYQQGAPTEVIWGEMPAEVYARRGNLRFLLPIAQQQNSGFFLDIEPGRQWLEQHASNKRVLNLFAYTCAFSVVAVAAGASKVVNVDMSSRALQWGREHHQHNGLDMRASEFLAEDIMKSWGRIKRRGSYDLVIIDPPSYQPGSFVAQKDYIRVVRRIPELMPEGGLVLACLNAPELSADFLFSVFAEACPECSLLERLTPSSDFPDINSGQQLKLLVFRYQPAGLAG